MCVWEALQDVDWIILKTATPDVKGGGTNLPWYADIVRATFSDTTWKGSKHVTMHS